MANLGGKVRTVIHQLFGVNAAAASTVGVFSWNKQEMG